jgi:pilus assembly protein CpaE
MQKDVIAIVISPDRSVHRQVEDALSQGGYADTVLAVSEYPDSMNLARLKEYQTGCVLFLDFADPVGARRIAEELDRAYPFVSVIAVHSNPTREDVMSLMQLGVRELIGKPIAESDLAVAFVRARRKFAADPTSGEIYAFLPAKPGAGATTIALSTAASIAGLGSERTLMLDFDLRLGLTSFLLQLDGHHCVQDALNQRGSLDEAVWSKLVSSVNGLDVLGSAPVEVPCEARPDEYNAVLNCAQSLYRFICVDLPGTMEPHELETLDRAKQIFLVCTADVTGLHMAKRKIDILKKLQLLYKVSVLINQAEKRSMLSMADTEKLLQAPVRFLLPRDATAVSAAVQQGASIQSNVPLGAQIESIAKCIIGASTAKASRAPARRFIEFFSVSPVRKTEKWS